MDFRLLFSTFHFFFVNFALFCYLCILWSTNHKYFVLDLYHIVTCPCLVWSVSKIYVTIENKYNELKDFGTLGKSPLPLKKLSIYNNDNNGQLKLKICFFLRLALHKKDMLQSLARNFPCKNPKKVGKLRALWKIMSILLNYTNFGITAEIQ